MKAESNLHAGDIQNIFMYRCRMARVRVNYPAKYSSLNCPLCENAGPNVIPHLDNQENLLNCIVIKQNCDAVKNNVVCKYSDIFGTDTQKMNETVKLLVKAMDTRNELLEQQLE